MKVHPEFSVYEHLPLAILVDFDGTITTRDIGDQIVINFAEPGWEKAMDRFRVGALNVRELLALELGMLREDRDPAALARANGQDNGRTDGGAGAGPLGHGECVSGQP